MKKKKTIALQRIKNIDEISPENERGWGGDTSPTK